MKGQVSLEFLVIAAAFTAVLALWLGGAATATAALSDSLETTSAKSELSKLASAVDTACVMGDKNTLQINFFVKSNATLNVTKNNLMLFTNNKTLEEPVLCTTTTPKNINAGKNTFTITNTAGKISVH